MKDMLPVLNGVHGGDWIACEMVSLGTGSRYPGMGGSCIASIFIMVGKTLCHFFSVALTPGPFRIISRIRNVP